MFFSRSDLDKAIYSASIVLRVTRVYNVEVQSARYSAKVSIYPVLELTMLTCSVTDSLSHNPKKTA